MGKRSSMQHKQPPWWPFTVLALLIGLVWVFWPSLLRLLSGYEQPEHNGQFGDGFGALNTLFSGLAFAALGYTMWMQRSELAETREILKSQKAEAEQQNSTLARQTFENTFFHLLRFQKELCDTSEINRIETHRGRKCFATMFSIAMTGINNGQVSETTRGGFSDSFGLQRKLIDDTLLPYVRNMVGILEFIQISDLPNKELYSSMLRNLLSNDEQKFLLFYAVADLGDSTRLLELTKEFELLSQVEMSDHNGMMLLREYESA